MAIDIVQLIKNLRQGATVICPLCGKGEIKPVYTEDYRTALVFACTECGEKMWMKERMPEKP